MFREWPRKARLRCSRKSTFVPESPNFEPSSPLFWTSGACMLKCNYTPGFVIVSRVSDSWIFHNFFFLVCFLPFTPNVNVIHRKKAETKGSICQHLLPQPFIFDGVFFFYKIWFIAFWKWLLASLLLSIPISTTSVLVATTSPLDYFHQFPYTLPDLSCPSFHISRILMPNPSSRNSSLFLRQLCSGACSNSVKRLLLSAVWRLLTVALIFVPPSPLRKRALILLVVTMSQQNH